MDAPPPASLNTLPASPAARLAAVLYSVAAAACLLLVVPVVYLAADLLVYKGRVTEYRDAGPVKQAAFPDQWEKKWKDDDAAEALTAMSPPTVNVLPLEAMLASQRWTAANSASLRRYVSSAAADEYLVEFPWLGDINQHVPTDKPIGVLATVARDRDCFAAYPLGLFACWNRFAWTNEGLLLELVIAAGVLFALCGVCLYLASRTAWAAAVDAARKLRRDLLAHAGRIGAVAVRPELQSEAGEVVADKVDALATGWVAKHTLAVRTAVVAVGAVLVMLAANVWLGLAVLLLAGLVWLAAGQSLAWVRRRVRQAGRRAESRRAVLRESLGLALLTKGYLMERFAQTRGERQLNELATAARREARGEALSRPVLFAVLAAVGLFPAYLAARMVLAGTLGLPAAVTLAACAAGVVASVLRWATAAARARAGRAAAADVAEFLDRRPDSSQAIDAEFLQPLSKKLDLIEVSYREPGTGRMVLEGASLSVPAGARAAVVCSDTDEARAIALLLARFVEPTAGEVRVDGKNVRWVTFDSLRAQVAVVLPDHATFSDTAANNIGCGDPSFPLPRIIEAAKAAHAHQFVQALPYGYETLVGTGGHALRPGERFRIALARAVLRDPAVIVVEEPVEPFDPDSQALIDDALTRLRAGRTLIMLTRRSAAVRAADAVIHVRGGRVTAGGPDDLPGGSTLTRSLAARG